ncbi:MAG: hypothetical protein ACJ8KO_08410, partial [Sulfurifustaceae bacterium]
VVLGQRTLQRRTERVIERIGRGPIIESVYGVGTVMATRSFQIEWGVASTIRALYVKRATAGATRAACAHQLRQHAWRDVRRTTLSSNRRLAVGTVRVGR